MKNLIRSSIAVVTLLLFLPTMSVADDFNHVGVRYDPDHKISIVSSDEKLFDANTSVGVSYSFPGHFMHQKPDTVSLSIFGYHDSVEWDKLKSLTFQWGGHTFTNDALHTSHGPDRDRSADLVNANYFETALAVVPIDNASDMFKAESVHVTSTPAGLDVTLKRSDMDYCRALIDSVPTLAAITPAIDTIPQSATGLPLDKHVDKPSGSVCLMTTSIRLTPKYVAQFLSFPTVKGKHVAHPDGAILMTEIDDDGDPELAKVDTIKVSTGASTFSVKSDQNDTQPTDITGEGADRRFYLEPKQFALLLDAPSLKIIVGSTVLSITHEQLAGLRSLAPRH